LDEPNRSPASELPGTPALLWFSVRFAVGLGPSSVPGSTVTLPLLLAAFGRPTTRSVMPSRLKSVVGIAALRVPLVAYVRMAPSLAYRFAPGHAVAKPSRCPATVLNVTSPSGWVLPSESVTRRVSVTLAVGLTPYWPSFHAAMRAADWSAAGVGLPVSKLPSREMPVE
jgi:hypothetical protein